MGWCYTSGRDLYIKQLKIHDECMGICLQRRHTSRRRRVEVNGQEFERLFLPTTHFLIKHKTKRQKLSLQI